MAPPSSSSRSSTKSGPSFKSVGRLVALDAPAPAAGTRPSSPYRP
eukprot:CAMPEP_0181042806 /NCGR_PEP_ID=MMETSP1070-20121207/12354_1 /TAXON_ID=265543 /ORGANISM="Minutocellus polymorphus, Strain NH13" /LENGTH=44 /DNA_ID= /DNA_START= /DNA_END= /DNA_ORIENTATION=